MLIVLAMIRLALFILVALLWMLHIKEASLSERYSFGENNNNVPNGPKMYQTDFWEGG